MTDVGGSREPVLEQYRRGQCLHPAGLQAPRLPTRSHLRYHRRRRLEPLALRVDLKHGPHGPSGVRRQHDCRSIRS